MTGLALAESWGWKVRLIVFINFLPCNASFALPSSCSFCVSCTRICETDSSSTEQPPVSSSSRFNISLTCFSTDTSSCRRTTSSCNSTTETGTKRENHLTSECITVKFSWFILLLNSWMSLIIKWFIIVIRSGKSQVDFKHNYKINKHTVLKFRVRALKKKYSKDALN